VLEGIAGDGRCVDQAAGRWREPGKLLGEHARDRGRNRGNGPGDRLAPERRHGLRGARQLFQVEGIAATLLVQPFDRRPGEPWPQKLVRLAPGQRAKIQTRDRGLPGSGGERGLETGLKLRRTERHEDEHTPLGGMAQQVGESSIEATSAQ